MRFKIISLAFLIGLVAYLNGCAFFYADGTASFEVRKISSNLESKGYKISSQALITHPTKFHAKEKELTCYIRDDKALVEKILSEKGEIEMAATQVFGENVKFKIIHYINNNFEEL